jgi:hypothetical protein
MAINLSLTADCKKVAVTITGAEAQYNHSVEMSLAGSTFTYNFPGGSTNTRIVNIHTQLGTLGGVLVVTHIQDGEVISTAAVISGCDILCCLAKKMEDLLDCNCECMKCSDDLVSAQKIFLLLKTAEAELATAVGRRTDINAVIANAEKKYNKAAEMCSGHCGCNC